MVSDTASFNQQAYQFCYKPASLDFEIYFLLLENRGEKDGAKVMKKKPPKKHHPFSPHTEVISHTVGLILIRPSISAAQRQIICEPNLVTTRHTPMATATCYLPHRWWRLQRMKTNYSRQCRIEDDSILFSFVKFGNDYSTWAMA